MSLTIRQQIINAVIARFQGILTTGGYNSNLGLNIFEWRTSPLEDGELPGAVIRDTTCDTIYLERHRHKMTVEVEISTATGTTTSASVRELIADIQKAVGVDPQWKTGSPAAALALNTYPSNDEISVIREDRTIGGAKINFIIEFRTAEWNPYSQ